MKKAFTLIELLVVITVIAILVGLTIPVSRYVSMRAKQAQYAAQVSKIKNALEDYRAKYGEYPVTPIYEYPEVVGSKTNTIPRTNDINDFVFHYPSNLLSECYDLFQADTNYNGPSDYTNVTIISNNYTNEYIREVIGEKEKNKVTVEYGLSYPLVIRPRSRGEQPYLDAPVYTVLYQATAKEYRRDLERTVRKRIGGTVAGRTYSGRYGWPINRTLVLDPRNGQQLRYTSDGLNYTIRSEVEIGSRTETNWIAPPLDD